MATTSECEKKQKNMIITRNTTVKEILEEAPNAVEIFAKHGVDVPVSCDDSVHGCELEVCDSMCRIDDLDALIVDLQKFFDSSTKSTS